MVDKKRKPFALYCDEPSLTKQSFKDECDINIIIERARLGADISHVNARVAQYGDFSNVPSYQESLDLVNRANGMFMSLDARIRERFANDPAKMIDFLQNPGNRQEAIALGLVVDRPEPTQALTAEEMALESKRRASARDSAAFSEKARRRRWIEIEEEAEAEEKAEAVKGEALERSQKK